MGPQGLNGSSDLPKGTVVFLDPSTPIPAGWTSLGAFKFVIKSDDGSSSLFPVIVAKKN